MKRRCFLQAGLAAALPRFAQGGGRKKHAHDRVLLGPRKVELSRMAIGTGTRGWGGSSNQTRKLGVRGLAELLEVGFDEGVTFWDSADQYGSHPHLKEALKRIPREKVAIMTKTISDSARDMKEDLDRFRREIGTDYLDIVLLHAETRRNWPEARKGAMEVLSEAQQKGIVKTVGISCHSLEALKVAAEHPWVEVDLVRLNPEGIRMDAGPDQVIPVLQKMKRNGKGIIGMKVLGLGMHPDRIDKFLQFQLAQDFVDCFTVGCESEDQFRDIVKRIPAVSARG